MHCEKMKNLFNRHLCGISGFTMRERQISMLNHMFNLSLHRYTEQRNEIHDENWPKHRNIKYIKERANDRNCC